MKDSSAINRRQFLYYFSASATATTLLGFNLKASLSSRSSAANALKIREDDPNTHNMLVFGEKTVYLSHLPMFDGINSSQTDFTSPHRYQVILEASFQKERSILQDIYITDRRANPNIKIYTLNPELFVLSRISSETTSASPLTTFKATVFRGHLERSGQKIDNLTNVDVKINRVIHFRKFNPLTVKPTQLRYLLFGNAQELFLAHYISGPPDFDQVLSVKIGDHNLTSSELSRGVEIVVPNKQNKVNDKLKEKQQARAQIIGTSSLKLEINVVSEIYFEEGELLLPPTFRETDSEKH